MKEYNVIGVDVDDVLVNFNELVLDKVNKRFNTNYKIEELEWNFVNLSPKHKDYAHQLFSDPDFFKTLEISSDGRSFLMELIKRDKEVILVTSIHPYVAHLRYDMFKEFDFDFIYTSRKDLVNVDVLIDDSPSNAAAAKNDFYLLTKPWNINMKHNFRIEKLEDFLRVLDNKN